MVESHTNGLDLIFKEKTLMILMEIYECEMRGKEAYIQQISNRIQSPHSYVWLVVKKLEELGFVETYQSGRTRLIHLTDKGYSVCNHIKKIVEILQN